MLCIVFARAALYHVCLQRTVSFLQALQCSEASGGMSGQPRHLVQTVNCSVRGKNSAICPHSTSGNATLQPSPTTKGRSTEKGRSTQTHGKHHMTATGFSVQLPLVHRQRRHSLWQEYQKSVLFSNAVLVHKARFPDHDMCVLYEVWCVADVHTYTIS